MVGHVDERLAHLLLDLEVLELEVRLVVPLHAHDLAALFLLVGHLWGVLRGYGRLSHAGRFKLLGGSVRHHEFVLEDVRVGGVALYLRKVDSVGAEHLIVEFLDFLFKLEDA